MSIKITKAEALARFHDKHAGWGDLRNHAMQKKAAEMLRKQELLLIECRATLSAIGVGTACDSSASVLFCNITDLLQETEDAE